MRKRSLRSSTERILLAWLAVAAPASAAAVAPEDAVEVESIARDVLSQSSYQTDWPTLEATQIPIPPGVADLANLLLWIGLAVVLALALIWIAQEVSGRGAAGRAAAMVPGGSLADLDRFAGGDPDELAAKGQYTEAIHQLLLSAIARLVRDLDRPPSASTTSRELSRMLPLGRSSREAFESIVGDVERSLFGGDEVGAEDYARCRRQYDAVLGGDAR